MGDPRPPTAPLPLPPHQLVREVAALPGWQLSPDGRSLVWSHRFSTAAASNAFVRWTVDIAEAQGRCPDLERKAGVVTVALRTEEVDAVTYQDVRLARALAGAGWA